MGRKKSHTLAQESLFSGIRNCILSTESSIDESKLGFLLRLSAEIRYDLHFLNETNDFPSKISAVFSRILRNK